MYKVFFKERIIFLGDESECLNYDGPIHYWNCNDDLKKVVSDFENDVKAVSLFLCGENVDSLFEAFKRCFHFIQAAGGWVWNSKKEFLAIYRLGKWDLPKGKVEKGETIIQGAVREVEEECSIHGLVLGDELLSTYHTYWMKGKWVLKRTYWFQMQYQGNQKPVPQVEEDIEQVEWFSLNRLNDFKRDTYASLKEVVNQVENILGIN